MKLFKKIEALGERNRIVPPWVRAIIALPFLGLATFMIVKKNGVYGALREFQLNNFDGYYVILTGMITLICCLIPAVFLVYLAQKIYKRRQNSTEIVGDVDDPDDDLS